MIKARNISPETLTRDLGQWLTYSLTAGAENAFALAVQNPYSDKDLIIDEVVIRVSVAGATSSVLNVDVGATATTAGDTIFDGIPLDASAPVIYSSHNVSDSGTNGNEKPHMWNKAGGANDYLNAQILAAGATALAGKVYVHVIESV